MQNHTGKMRLSDSALDLLHNCERKFQLERLLVGSPEKQEYPATILGKAFGSGVATYLLTQDQDKAIYAFYKAYYPELEDEVRSLTIGINLLISTFTSLDNLLQDYEVAFLNGKPAEELSFSLDIDEKYYFVGYIDVVLRNKWNGKYAILENKTTGLNIYDLSPLYANSGQALGYSIALDTIAGEEMSEYEVIYIVGQLGTKANPYNNKIHTFTFPKNLADRLNWFIALQLDVNRINDMLAMNIFPMRGSSCLHFMRPCNQFGTCQLHGLDEYLPPLVDDNLYDFNFSLDAVIANHLERIQNVTE